MENLLRIESLTLCFGPRENPSRVVTGVDLEIGPHETVALVGESGCGKSMTALAVTRLAPSAARYESGRILFHGSDILDMDEPALRRLRGREIAYIFQDPAGSLNPVLRVGQQIEESLVQAGYTGDRRGRVLELLGHVRIQDPARVAKAYPHELSGGMQQRVMIAMALACEPKLLIADEPTTALDVTVQAEILALLGELQASTRMSVLLITHNLGLVAGCAARMYVMYAGQIIETGDVDQVLRAPRHPYTKALLMAVPDLDRTGALKGIDGQVPDPARLPTGCPFHPRCERAREHCIHQFPAWEVDADKRGVRCHFWK